MPLCLSSGDPALVDLPLWVADQSEHLARHGALEAPNGWATDEVANVSSILDIVERSDGVSIVPALALALPVAAQRFHVRPMVGPAIRRAIGLMVAHGAKMGQLSSAPEINSRFRHRMAAMQCAVPRY
jgi:DNA-binding transcriptional LysR family regulator